MPLSDLTVNHVTPKLKWINLLGYNKSGKTKTLVKLSKLIPTFIIDADRVGSKPYIGAKTFVHVGLDDTVDEMSVLTFSKRILPEILVQNEYKIAVVDPVTSFFVYMQDSLMKGWNIKDLKDKQIEGLGNGWTYLYRRFETIMNQLFASFDLVITVSHLKMAQHYKGDSIKVSYGDINLIGQARDYVADKADCHLAFYDGVDEKGKHISKINWVDDTGLREINIGSRHYKFVERIKTDEDFLKEMCKMFNVPYRHIPDEEVIGNGEILY